MSVSSLPILLTGATLVSGKCHNRAADPSCRSAAPQGLPNAVVWANGPGPVRTSASVFMNYDGCGTLPLMSRDRMCQWWEGERMNHQLLLEWNKKKLFLGCKSALQVTLITEVTLKSIRMWALGAAISDSSHPPTPANMRSAVQPDGNSKWPS